MNNGESTHGPPIRIGSSIDWHERNAGSSMAGNMPAILLHGPRRGVNDRACRSSVRAGIP
jgi:hypothetical protein